MRIASMQNEATLEELFERYRTTADHEALAAVFDQTAPRLLLVAAHVTPDPAAAEDLVQETFLAAMQKADQWDRTRPLLPWLSGVLRHRAMDLSRRLRHRRPTAPTELMEQATKLGTDPSDEAAAEELLERVDQALQSLTSPFREALVLRLVHGLEPTEIAHALGRPPSTVRVQLKRGLERMREALPATLTGVLSSLLLPGSGLAAVRTEVLRVAESAVQGLPVAPSPVAQGALKASWGMRSILLSLGGIAAAALVWALIANDDRARLPSEGRQTVSARPPARSGTGAVSESDRASLSGPRRVASNSGDVSSTAGQASTIRGRLVDRETGLPVPDGRVTLSFGRGRFVTSDPTFRTYPDPIAFACDRDGRFAARWTPSPRMRVYFRALGPSHVPIETEWVSVRNGLDIDLGDLSLVRGTELAARCVGEDGVPIPGVEITADRISGDPDGPDSAFSSSFLYHHTSGAGGELPATLLPSPGTYGLSVANGSGPWRVVAGQNVELLGGPRQFHDIVVEPVPITPKPRLHGQVLDLDGNPVPAGFGLQVHADMPELGSAVTGPDGSFELIPSSRGRTASLALPRAERRYRLSEPDRRYTLGDERVVVRVERLSTFDVPIEVVDSQTGQPVERFGLRHEVDYWADERSFAIPPEQFYWPAAPERHDEGRLVLEQLPVGRYRLNVYPESADLSTAYMVAFEVGENGADPVTVELQPHAPIDIHVHDDLGEPIRNKKVRLVHLLANESWASLFSVEELRQGVGGGRRMAIALEETRTDASGRCRIQAPVGDPRLVLVLGGVGALGDRHELGAVPIDGRDVEIEVPATSVLQGQIGPPELLAGIGPSEIELTMDAIVRAEDSELSYSLPRLRLIGPDRTRGGETPLSPDGSFSFDEASPGDWRLVLDLEWRRGAGRYRKNRAELAVIDQLRPGETRVLDIDASQLLPARLSGSALVDGAFWNRGRFGVLTSDPENDDRFQVPLRDGGTFDFVVGPDRYLPYVTWSGDENQEAFLFATDRVQLGRGRKLDQSFAFEHRAVHLQLLDAGGAPAEKREIELGTIDYPEVLEVIGHRRRTDSEGKLILDPAPPGRIEIRTPDGVVLGLVTARPKSDTGLTTLRLPN